MNKVKSWLRSNPRLNSTGDELDRIKQENQWQVVDMKKENIDQEHHYDLRFKQRNLEQEQKSRDHEANMDRKRALIESLEEKRKLSLTNQAFFAYPVQETNLYVLMVNLIDIKNSVICDGLNFILGQFNQSQNRIMIITYDQVYSILRQPGLFGEIPKINECEVGKMEGSAIFHVLPEVMRVVIRHESANTKINLILMTNSTKDQSINQMKETEERLKIYRQDFGVKCFIISRESLICPESIDHKYKFNKILEESFNLMYNILYNLEQDLI